MGPQQELYHDELVAESYPHEYALYLPEEEMYEHYHEYQEGNDKSMEHPW